MTCIDPLTEFTLRQQRLAVMIRRLSAAVTSLEHAPTTDALAALAARVASDVFSVSVLGDVRTGKSTLISAMRSQRELPGSIRLAEVSWPRVQASARYLAQADAFVVVLDATRPFAAARRQFVANHGLPLASEQVFFVYNRINQVPSDERDTLITAAARWLSGLGAASLRPDRLYFVNALGALNGRACGDEDLLADSQVPIFEAALQAFLTQEKGTAKLLASATELAQHLRQARDLIRHKLSAKATLTTRQAAGLTGLLAELESISQAHGDLVQEIGQP